MRRDRLLRFACAVFDPLYRTVHERVVIAPDRAAGERIAKRQVAAALAIPPDSLVCFRADRIDAPKSPTGPTSP